MVVFHHSLVGEGTSRARVSFVLVFCVERCLVLFDQFVFLEQQQHTINVVHWWCVEQAWFGSECAAQPSG